MEEPTGGSATEFFHSSQWQVLEERVEGVTQAQYVWSAVYVDALVLRDWNGDGLTDGQLDEGFGTSGMAVTDLGGSNREYAAAIQQSDGKIVMVGTTGGTGSDFAVARVYRVQVPPPPHAA